MRTDRDERPNLCTLLDDFNAIGFRPAPTPPSECVSPRASSVAAKLGVSVAWLESGAADPAEELARLVLEAKKNALPPSAQILARRVLRDQNALVEP